MWGVCRVLCGACVGFYIRIVYGLCGMCRVCGVHVFA